MYPAGDGPPPLLLPTSHPKRVPASAKHDPIDKRLLAASAFHSEQTAHEAVAAAAAALTAPSSLPQVPAQTQAQALAIAGRPRSSATHSSPLDKIHHPHRKHHHNVAMPPPDSSSALNKISGLAFGRAESISSNSGATTFSSRTMLTSSEPPSSADGRSSLGSSSHLQKPFVVRNGRTYLSDPTLPYPLPVDLAEQHRQSLRTLMLFQIFNGPVCSPAFANKPPMRVLEVGCGSGFWSMMCHRYYKQQGHPNISFTGMDIAPFGSGIDGKRAEPAPASGTTEARPDKDMNWRFVQHDMRKFPWPFPDEEFDLVMCKDMSMAVVNGIQQNVIDEWLRMLKPGGTLECWDSDHTVRMLRPHVPEAGSGSDDEDDEQDVAARVGAYVLTANTPLSAPLNNYLVEYNGWVQKALEQRQLCPMPCTVWGPILVQESDVLTGVGARRTAIPLSEVKWEREGVGGVVTKDGKSYIETTKGKGRDNRGKSLTAAQQALRQTALLTVVQMIQSLEPMLREVSGKSQDEWDAWSGKMMNDLVKENGTSWGECLEIGSWWARKRK